MQYFYFVIILILIIEIIIFLSYKKIKNKFPWMISREDLYPKFDKNKFLSFKYHRYDLNLGWSLKPGYKNFDKVNKKKINYSIDKRGFRSKRKFKKELIASFGDSYVFCRQVINKDTWQEQMTKNKNYCVLNFGEGNFGFDQSILKYEKTKLKKETKFIIQGFVPETITRIQSEWKHFLEFGNIHAFKPKFQLINGKLVLKKNSLKKNTKIENLHKIINKIKHTDRFYNEKFSKHTLQFPYSVNFFKNFFFNYKIFLNFYLYNLMKLYSLKSISIENKLFEIVVKNNLEISHGLYRENLSKNLMSRLIKKYVNITGKNNHIPILIVFPQLLDLKLKTSNLYKNYFKDLTIDVHVIDLTDYMHVYNIKKLYINDHYGGHFSKFGNKIAGKIINKEIDKILKYYHEKNF